jgi:Zn-dependent protease
MVLVGIVLSVAAHEAGHLIPALLFGVKIKAAGVNWMGCYVRRVRAAGWRESVICLGGPVVSLAIALCTTGLISWFNLWILLLAQMLPLPGTDFSNAFARFNCP